MRCFYHADVEAVAICKSCGHAVCHDCCAEVGTGAACRDRCESDVAALNVIIERSKTTYSRVGGVTLRGSLFQVVFGLAFTGLGVAWYTQGSPYLLFLIIGPLFLIFGIVNLFASRHWRQK